MECIFFEIVYISLVVKYYISGTVHSVGSFVTLATSHTAAHDFMHYIYSITQNVVVCQQYCYVAVRGVAEIDVIESYMLHLYTFQYF